MAGCLRAARLIILLAITGANRVPPPPVSTVRSRPPLAPELLPLSAELADLRLGTGETSQRQVIRTSRAACQAVCGSATVKVAAVTGEAVDLISQHSFGFVDAGPDAKQEARH